MSDRVDEQRREEQRIEQQRLQRTLEGKKQTEVKESFARVVKNIKDAKAQDAKQEGARQEKHARGQAGLAAKRGIDNRNLARQVAHKGESQAFRGRRELARAGEARDLQRGQAHDEELARMLGRKSEGGTARGGRARDPGQQEGGESRRKGDGERAGGAGQRADEALAVAGQMATQQAVTGVASKEAGASSAGLHTDLQQIIDELVDAVHRGVDKNNFGFMHIELKSHILSGSSLSLQSTREGIHLKVQTEDDEVARLLSSGGTAKELSQALDGRGVKLASLEVNQERVLG